MLWMTSGRVGTISTTEEQIMRVDANTLLARVCGKAARIVFGGATCLALSQLAAATPEYAKQTGKACAACHESASDLAADGRNPFRLRTTGFAGITQVRAAKRMGWDTSWGSEGGIAST
jgi:hypothetical protein